MLKILALILLTACSTTPKVERAKDVLFEQVKNKQRTLIAEYTEITKDRASGWLSEKDCDGMLWSALGASFHCPKSFNIRAAQFEKGRFGRKPSKDCWIGKQNGSRTSWSQDMGMGLLTYAMKCEDKDLVADHLIYGTKNNYIYGEGQPAYVWGAAYYRLGIRGLMGKVASYNGFPNTVQYNPTIYPPKLDDYAAHLQMLEIYMRSYMTGHLTSLQKTRVLEHIKRVPLDPFFMSLGAKFGLVNFRVAADLCLAENDFIGEYVRCHDIKECRLSQMLKACGILLEAYR